MSAYRERRPSHRRRSVWPLALALVGAVVAFAVGLAVGEALHDNPSVGGGQTVVRTLEPLQVAPAAATTVTVTTP